MVRLVKVQNLRNLNLLHLSNRKLSNRLKIQAKRSRKSRNGSQKAIFSAVFHVFVKDDFFLSILIKIQSHY